MVQLASVMLLHRFAIGLVGAAAIALVARRARSLSTSGAIAATVVGGMTAAAGWSWAALLIIYFVTSSALSRLNRSHAGDVVAKGGARDVYQVFANGGVFATCALLAQLADPEISSTLSVAAIGALAAATADTWSTEIGMRFGGTPRALFTMQPASSGTSGAVSAVGTLGMLGGAMFIALISRSLLLGPEVTIVVCAGVAGAMIDSILGATLQDRRWCASCDRSTERRVHRCGSVTSHVGGLQWLDNDVVNLVATIVGAALATLLVMA